MSCIKKILNRRGGVRDKKGDGLNREDNMRRGDAMRVKEGEKEEKS